MPPCNSDLYVINRKRDLHVLLNLYVLYICMNVILCNCMCYIYMHQLDLHVVIIYIYQNAFLAHRRDPRTMKPSDTPKP